MLACISAMQEVETKKLKLMLSWVLMDKMVREQTNLYDIDRNIKSWCTADIDSEV